MKFEDINAYMERPKEERQAHLNLSEECIQIGGESSKFRGLLAHYLKTTIPSGMKIHLAHACHNGGCSNPNHMYWGTSKENYHDMMDNGKWRNAWDRMKDKIGELEAKKINSAAGSLGGLTRKGKPSNNKSIVNK